jgi:hypothetical protein
MSASDIFLVGEGSGVGTVDFLLLLFSLPIFLLLIYLPILYKLLLLLLSSLFCFVLVKTMIVMDGTLAP